MIFTVYLNVLDRIIAVPITRYSALKSLFPTGWNFPLNPCRCGNDDGDDQRDDRHGQSEGVENIWVAFFVSETFFIDKPVFLLFFVWKKTNRAVLWENTVVIWWLIRKFVRLPNLDDELNDVLMR